MTDLSYTNKDGLNLYEGFNNGFDYHKDGKESGDGYEHGGYPEITGETSDLPNTNYKSGDNTDFFNNGNTFDIIPREDPTPVLTGIEITTPPTRLNYYNFTNVSPSIRNTYGEEFADEVLDLTGMVVTANYSDGSSEVISDYTVSPAAGTLLLTDSFTVTYEDKEATQQLQTTMLECISSVNWDGPDSPESSVEEYVFFDALELNAPTVVGLVNARQEGEAQSLCASPLENATVYTDNEGNTYNIPASGDSPTDADCRIIGPLAEPYDEKTIILTRIS